MKQIPRPDHPVVFKSIAVCTVASAIIAADSLSPIQPAGADDYAYSKVDQHCLPGIDRSVAIPQNIADDLQTLPAFADLREVIANVGVRVYCQLPPKRITMPNGSGIWGNPYILPIEGTSQVLVITVDEFGQVLKVENWNAAPDQPPNPAQRSINYFLQPGNVDRAILPYDRRNQPAQTTQSPQPECR